MPAGIAIIPKEDGNTGTKCGETGQCIIRGLYYPDYILLGRIWCLSSVPLSPLPCKECRLEVSQFFLKNVSETLLLLCWVALANVLCTSYWPLWIVKAFVAMETWPKIVGTVLGLLVGNDGKRKVKSSVFCLESGDQEQKNCYFRKSRVLSAFNFINITKTDILWWSVCHNTVPCYLLLGFGRMQLLGAFEKWDGVFLAICIACVQITLGKSCSRSHNHFWKPS